jgi:hypothetical protein
VPTTTVSRSRTRRVLVTAALVVAGCGGDDAADDAGPADEPAESAAPTTASTAPAPTTEAAATPSDLGDEIAASYLAAYDDVIAALADRPERAVATDRLTALQADYIDRMVALGHEREALDDAGRATVDAKISGAVMRLPEDTLAEYQAAADHYFDSQDTELYDLILAFNIIGQYANFDLLRDQEPDEAARLGLD